MYLSRTGRLSFGIRQNNVRKVITTTRGYRDGKWRQVVATLSSAGAALYVDGARVRSSQQVRCRGGTTATGASVATWRPAALRARKNYLTGDLDEFAVYPHALAAQVRSHDAR